MIISKAPKDKQFSIVLDVLPSRKLYLKQLILGLEDTVQLMPHDTQSISRSRLDHCINMARLARKYILVGNKAKRSVIESCMLHDIGHHRYGHDAEREILKIFNVNDFSNTSQSLRFCSNYQNSKLPIFQSPKYENTHLLEEKSSDEYNGVLNELDYLENCFGDILDLYHCYNKNIANELIKVFSKNISLSEFNPKNSFELIDHLMFFVGNNIPRISNKDNIALSFFDRMSCDLDYIHKKINTIRENSFYFKEHEFTATKIVNLEVEFINKHYGYLQLSDRDCIDILTSLKA